MRSEAGLLFAVRLFAMFLQASLNYFHEDFSTDQERTDAAFVLAFSVVAFLEDWDNDGLLPCSWNRLCAPHFFAEEGALVGEEHHRQP